jgi:hypothetical protein
LIAFECKQIKKSIGDNVPYDTDITNDASMEDELKVFTVSLGEEDCVLPSQLLSDKCWVRFVVLLLNLKDLNVSNTLNRDRNNLRNILTQYNPIQQSKHS